MCVASNESRVDRAFQFRFTDLKSEVGLQIEPLDMARERFCRQTRSSSILVGMADQVDALVLDGRRRCRLSGNGDRRRRGMSGRDGGSRSSSCDLFLGGNQVAEEFDETLADRATR